MLDKERLIYATGSNHFTIKKKKNLPGQKSHLPLPFYPVKNVKTCFERLDPKISYLQNSSAILPADMIKTNSK